MRLLVSFASWVNPIERVRPHPDHIYLACYYWCQAQSFSQKPIRLDDKEFRVDWVASRRGGGEDFGPVSTGAVARLGYLRASRSLCVYFEDESDIDEDDLLKNIGIVESMVPFVTKSNVRGFDITFLSVEACWQFYEKCTRGELRGLSSDSLQFIDRMGLRGHQKFKLEGISRGVIIHGLPPDVAISPYLREHVEALSSMLLQARPHTWVGDRVTAIHQTSDSVSIKFVTALDARLFLKAFPAARFGATMDLVKTKPLAHHLRLAIKSGAGRALTMSLPISRSLSVEELTRAFSQFSGLVDVTKSTDHVILRYKTVVAASKTVCALEAGTHFLLDKYTGARSERGTGTAFSWTGERKKPPAFTPPLSPPGSYA
ncbi:hypothetical protein BDZ89DRAFT_1123359 [Hymenopellis radicata]|nr:hypothetical protein BDZ89DRAFT_1123359 [Hymenopellis radicata]